MNRMAPKLGLAQCCASDKRPGGSGGNIAVFMSKKLACMGGWFTRGRHL